MSIVYYCDSIDAICLVSTKCYVDSFRISIECVPNELENGANSIVFVSKTFDVVGSGFKLIYPHRPSMPLRSLA